jgi:hypothetical protein
MKLLSDFDGVWTHPAAEAAAQGALLDERLAACAPPARQAEARAWIAAARAATLAEPARWGWTHDGRIAAWADEDPFAAHGALLHYLQEHADAEPLAALLLAGASARGEGSLDRFSLAAHLEAVARIEATRGPGVLPEAAQAGRELLARGVEVVLVSNSRPEKLARWFAHAHLPHRTHPGRATGALRVRGDAGKHVLAAGPAEYLELGALRIERRRPHYEGILREEAPDAVVGDVFSLDLAVPLALRRGEPSWRDVRIFWLLRDYTPARLRAAVAAHAPEVEAIAGGLPAVAEALRGS